MVVEAMLLHPFRKLKRVDPLPLTTGAFPGDQILVKIMSGKCPALANGTVHRLYHKLWLINRPKSMLAQQLYKLCDAPLFIRAHVIMDVPAKIILPKFVIVFRPG